MNNAKEDNNLKRLEEALRESFRQEATMDHTFKKNLDKLVENTIKAKELDQKQAILERTGQKKKGFLEMVFTGAKWQVALLTSFLGVLLFGGLAFAAVPQLREIVAPTKGILYVSSDPEGAKIELRGGEYVDFTLLGEVPIKREIKAGKYEMRVTLEKYEEYITTFELEAGKSVNLDINLKKKQTALEKIKEWKTYTDLERGFEFTYPLNWKFESVSDLDSEDPLHRAVRIYNENSEMFIYFGTLEIEEKAEVFSVESVQYRGLEDTDGYKYVVLDEFKDEDETNFVKSVFYTQDLEGLEIYDFIKSTVKVHKRSEDDSQTTSWIKFTRDDFGFSLRYPKEDWIVVERSVSEYYAEYGVKKVNSTDDPLRVIYSYGYFDEQNEFSFEATEVIGGVSVDKYNSPACDGKYLYAYPNRLFIIYQLTSDADVNEVFGEIINSFQITKENSFQEIYDYTWMYSLKAPKVWTYSTEINEVEFYGVYYAGLSGEYGIVKIFKWKDVEGSWTDFASTYDSQNLEYRTSTIKIDGLEYKRIEAWINWGGNYSLSRIFYINGDFGGDLTVVDPKVSIGGEYFVIMFVGDVGNIEELTNVPDETESKIRLIDAVVSSMKRVEY
ncbi:PEGA domain-containing protein [Candidatus Dojkabacteria bacterium]|nr:PEGA domain-containing protein [Candidatus Dojkabacteria bacterium]